MTDRIPGYWGDFSKKQFVGDILTGEIIGGSSVGAVSGGAAIIPGAIVGGVAGTAFAVGRAGIEAFDTTKFARTHSWFPYDENEVRVKWQIPALAEEIEVKQEQIETAEYSAARNAKTSELTWGNVDAAIADLKQKDPILAERVFVKSDEEYDLKPTDEQIDYILDKVLDGYTDLASVKDILKGINPGRRSIWRLEEALEKIENLQKKEEIALGFKNLIKLGRVNNSSFYDKAPKSSLEEAQQTELAEYILKNVFSASDESQIAELKNVLQNPIELHKKLSQLAGSDNSKLQKAIDKIEEIMRWQHISFGYSYPESFPWEQRLALYKKIGLRDESGNALLITPEKFQALLAELPTEMNKEEFENNTMRQIPLSIAEAYAILNQKEPVIPPQPKPEEQNAPEPAKETETKTTLDPNKITGF